MSKRKPVEINLNTPKEALCKEELNKLASQGFLGNLKADFRDTSREDIPWESEAIAKSHGVYLEFNRAKSGEDKEWIYLFRISIPGGGPLTREQYNLVDDLTEQYTKDPDGFPSIRLTNRQNIQLHWVKKANVGRIIKAFAESGLNTLNGCGDNTRNVMGCPMSRYSSVFNANAFAQKCGAYFQLPLEPFISVWEIDPTKVRKPGESFDYGPQLLNRKFKIGIAGVIENANGQLSVDNCAEVLTDDMGVIPVIEGNKVVKFQIYLGGGQGERNGKPSMACMAKPFCQTDEAHLLKVLDAVIKVHQHWGDRQNRIWARVKFVVKTMGIDWYRQQTEKILGYKLELPNPKIDVGHRHMHHGWFKQPDGRWTYGAFIENGRLIDNSPNGKLKSMCRFVMNKYPIEFMITPNQDALFCNIPEGSKAEFESDLKKFGYGQRNGKAYSTLRKLSGACVGRDTCRLTYTDSEKFEPYLIDELEALGWGDITESIGMTGCERQCFRPATKTIGLVGSGLNRYQLKLMGTEDAKHQGLPLLLKDSDDIYLRSIPRERVAAVIDVLLKYWKANAKPGEGLGYFNNRIGMEAIINLFKNDPTTSDLMAKAFPADCVVE
ncbi:MAG: nitrite/sulfite reductase [Candidatus Omnitrophica bacterium]|nr:nitrite/sulfite reductase [Candidatus Omnitrophota bacterium]